MDRERGLVSIGLPVYNGETYLAEALGSIARQTYPNLEIIISDNGSADATEVICRQHAALDPRVSYFKNAVNRGSVWNFNAVFERARGEYFKWWAYDDLCEPTYVAKCVDVLERDPTVCLCFARTTIIDEHGRRVQDYDDQMDLRSFLPELRFRQMLFRRAKQCNAQFGVIRASVLERTPLLGRYAASDDILLTELALRGRIYQIPENLFLRRDHPRTSMRMHVNVRRVIAYVDPQKSGDFHLPHWRWLLEHSRAIQRVPATPVVKLRCYGALVAWFCRFSHRFLKDVLLVARNGFMRAIAFNPVSRPKSGRFPTS
jgi:glycosyltransferase involved in cell wall biosynthesis